MEGREQDHGAEPHRKERLRTGHRVCAGSRHQCCGTWIPVVDKPAGLAVKIRQIDHFWKVVNRLEIGAARKGAGSQRFNASEFLRAPSCNRGQTHAFCLQIPPVRLTEQVACSKPNLDLEQSNKATCPHFFFPFRRGLGRNRSQDHTATCSLFWGSKKHAGPGPAAPVVKNVGYESQMSGGASKPPTPLRARG